LKKEHKIKTWDEWNRLQWDLKFEKLRTLSFSRLSNAALLFEDIYGFGCFDLAWGHEVHARLDQRYTKYQTLRNGILHRGGELSSGEKIEASETEIAITLDDAKLFREAILRLSQWCRHWWIEKAIQTNKGVH